jgi:hypothetical protein
MRRSKDFPHFQAAFRALDLPRCWAVEELSGYPQIVRVKLDAPDGMRELSCLPTELDVALDWARRTSAGEARPALIVAEHWQRPWTHVYRWTLAAWQRARELDGERRAS